MSKEYNEKVVEFCNVIIEALEDHHPNISAGYNIYNQLIILYSDPENNESHKIRISRSKNNHGIYLDEKELVKMGINPQVEKLYEAAKDYRRRTNEKNFIFEMNDIIDKLKSNEEQN